ncbi:GntR family transcriptional regulator [Bacteroides caecigallinarum]|uniref:GntR family transcriptional regulator n=1 Tax=Bacteroides caecigallinarum TaxID=1411144 RepID=UPI00195E9E34|nr:GntR family transcriptional regulator [Bacteroides caecigallinarum]MBM6864266.1 GntR family transcriptional regulator [Bacteroides caecigallinarum]MBU3809246.1 GntR family transcriptional regulator [Candidatus Phocaeicola faecipullorum]
MTDFKQDRAIYLQMAERICDEILAGKYNADDRIPSVRELAVLLEVNTNTVVKTYELLLQWEVIYTKRGLGYFVTTDALKKIRQTKSSKFMNENLPELFRQMELLDISIETVIKEWEVFRVNKNQ